MGPVVGSECGSQCGRCIIQPNVLPDFAAGVFAQIVSPSCIGSAFFVTSHPSMITMIQKHSDS